MPPHGSNHPGEQRAHLSVGGLPYLLALPAALSAASSSFPLLLFLHGAGESGSNPQELLAEGATGTPTSLAKAHAPHLEQFIVASPQTDRGWDGQPGELVVKLLDELLEDKRLKIDAHRVYLSGVSMGGAGVWSVASAHPARFAAIVPVCGYGNAERVASALAASPAAQGQGPHRRALRADRRLARARRLARLHGPRCVVARLRGREFALALAARAEAVVVKPA